MAMDLRPLTLGELLDRAFHLYRRHLLLFVGIMAVPSVLALAMNLLVEFMQRAAVRPVEATSADVPPVPDIGVALAMFGGFIVLFMAYLVVYAVALGATTLAVSEIYQERSTTIGDVYGRMRGRIGRLVWLLVIMGFRIGLIGVGGLLVVTALIGGAAVFSRIASALLAVVAMAGLLALCTFILLRWGLAVPAVVLEDCRAGEAIGRSVELTKGRLGRVLLLGVCATMITYAAILLFQGPFIVGTVVVGPQTTSGFWLSLAGLVSGTIGTALTGPIMIVGLALLYYDARVREEGLDLQLMMAALDARPAAGLARD